MSSEGALDVARVFGAMVTIVGIGASEADVRTAAVINLSLILAVVMVALGAIFIGWIVAKPLEMLRAP